MGYYLPMTLAEYSALSPFDRRAVHKALVDFLKGKGGTTITGGPPRQEAKLGLA